MPHAIWTPLPPERSGIADYSYELIEALATVSDVTDITDVVAVSRDPGAAIAPPGVPVVGPGHEFAPDTVHVYHMGNHAAAHAWIHERALAVPGVVVLHDLSLLDFYASLHGGVGSTGFAEEARHAHGPIRGGLDDPALIEGWPAVDVDGVLTLDRQTLTMERRLVESALAVVVHDSAGGAFLRARYPGKPVHVVASGAPIRDDTARARVRSALGWHPDHVVFGVFGGLGRIKRPTVALLAFAEVRGRWPQARLLVTGHADATDVLIEMRRLVADLGLEGSVHLALSPDKDEFEDLITATDALVNLRWPTAGETSAVMMRAFGAGRVVITSDLPQHRHLDPEFCRRIPTEPAAEARALQLALEHAVSWPEELRAAGERARGFAREHAAWPVVAQAHLTVLADAARAEAEPARTAAVTSSRLGVNVFADVRATTGLAESARRHITTLADSGVEVAFTEFNTRAANRSLPLAPRFAELRRGKEFPIDLWFVNVNEFQLVPDSALDRYTIAMWAWELPEAPPAALPHLSKVDELWVLSSFVADAFRAATDVPITVVPSVVPQQPGTAPDRARLGLPDDGLIVLFTFSASSSDARKNPWAAIEAFRQAFRPTEWGRDAHLVVKANDLDRFPELARHLGEAVSGVRGVLLREEMSRSDMDCLLATCDVYLSLHRSEGFGLGMAEAMAMGKAVVGTGFGGNVDFMLPGSAAVVGYDVRPIRERDHQYGAAFGDWYRVGQLWAEPDTAQAARWLRWLADDPRRRERMGAKAIEAIRATCGPETVGAIMAERLAAIDASLGLTRTPVA